MVAEYERNRGLIRLLETTHPETRPPKIDLGQASKKIATNESVLYEAAPVLKKKSRAISSIDAVPEVSADNIVGLYLAETGRWPLLSAEDEQRLFVQIKFAKRAERRLKIPELSDEERQEKQELIKKGEQAEEMVTNCNLRLVVNLAKRYLGRGVPFLDLIQEGNLGLLKAVDKFDIRLGWRFSTYATYWVKQSLVRALDNQGRIIRLPINIHERLGKVLKAARDLEQELSKEPTAAQIAEEIGLSSQQVEFILEKSEWTFSLEELVGFKEDTEFGALIGNEDSPDPEEESYKQLLKEQIDDLLTSLKPREARILRMRFGLQDGKSQTLEEVGQKFGLTRERIRQIEHEALDRLRHPSRSRKLRK